MRTESSPVNDRHMTSLFEKYLTVWVALCMVGGILIGKFLPVLSSTRCSGFAVLWITNLQTPGPRLSCVATGS